jgi:mannose-1-phosphate guanylyltransferase
MTTSNLPSTVGMHRDLGSLAGIILAGGNGTRLSSIARAITGHNVPKQFCPLIGEETLLEQTRRRVALLIPSHQIMTVLMHEHESFYKRLLELSEPNLVIQPNNRGTAPAILYSLLRLIRLGHHGSVAIFPSDHYVSDDKRFMLHVEAAWKATLLSPERIVLLGVRADRPESQYGWIEPAHPIDSEKVELARVTPVRRFWEKPHPDLAMKLWQRGFLWNSFVVVATTTALLDLFARALADLYIVLAPVLSVIATSYEREVISDTYRRIAAYDFSKAIEGEIGERLYVLPINGVKWNDLGEPNRVLATINQLGIHPKWMPPASNV